MYVLPDGLESGNHLFFAVALTPLLMLALLVLATGDWPVERRAGVSST